jgi:hypothetical protein
MDIEEKISALMQDGDFEWALGQIMRIISEQKTKAISDYQQSLLEKVNQDKKVLKKIKKLANGKFGKTIIIEGDAQIVLNRLFEIYATAHNYLIDCGEEKEEELNI